jgi:spectinomycin phosphotransferase
VFTGLRLALSTAAALRYQVGLEFVVAPIAARDGNLLRRLDGRHTVSVFPFLPAIPTGSALTPTRGFAGWHWT